MAEEGLQIIMTSHSPYFINLDYLEGIYLVKKTDEGTYTHSTDAQSLSEYCIQKGAHRDRTTRETIIPFYAKSATDNILKGFFANLIILVEGPSEELALPIYLEKAGMDIYKEGIDVIGVGGKGNLAKWWRFFTHYDIPCFVCFDNDAKYDDPNGVKRKDALQAIGIPENELDDNISIEDWNIFNEFCILGVDFETTLRKYFNQYTEIENDVKNELGDSKPIVARETAKKLPFSNDEEGWQKFNEFVDKIK